MEKSLNPINFKLTDNGTIEISQDFHDCTEESTIYLGREDANILVGWLQEAIAKIDSKGK